MELVQFKDGKRKAFFLRVDQDEALQLIKSLAAQVLSWDPNSERVEFSNCIHSLESGSEDRDMWCSGCDEVVLCRFAPSHDAGPYWRCSECGEVVVGLPPDWCEGRHDGGSGKKKDMSNDREVGCYFSIAVHPYPVRMPQGFRNELKKHLREKIAEREVSELINGSIPDQFLEE